MLAAGDSVVAWGGRIYLRGERVRGQFEEAIKAATVADADFGDRGTAVAATRKNGSPFVAQVSALENGSAKTGSPLRAFAVVFIAEDDEEHALQAQAVSLLYGLTPMETRVFELIIEGRTSKEMSAALSIAASTLKTHTLRVFGKTGRHRRSDLVRLGAEVGPRS
jgi:DNA-binding CsgD family transcriptional regulator